MQTDTDPARDQDRGALDTGHLVVDRTLAQLCGSALKASEPGNEPTAAQVQPASVDLRLASVAWRVRCGFLPGAGPVEDRLAELGATPLSLEGSGAVLERGQVYLVPLQEALDLPSDLRARFNPRSSTGRCDIFTRVLCEGHPRFDEAPPGFTGRLWLEVAPLSFPVRLKRGDRLCQVRLVRGRARLTTEELRAAYEETPLCFVREAPGTPESPDKHGAPGMIGEERPLTLDEVELDDEGGLLLSVSLRGRAPDGWRAASHTGVVDFSAHGVHPAEEFFEPVHARGGCTILTPGSFYVFASRERLRIPPHLAAEMLPVDVGIGELRNNYAGFFDNGFGWTEDEHGTALPRGTPAVLEVRAHDVPFLVEHGQVFFRLTLFRTDGRPDALYGEGRASYREQDLTLARCFHSASTA